MELTLAPRDKVWRSRGVPARQIPDELKSACDQSLRNRKVVQLSGLDTPEEHRKAREIVSLARTYAKSIGKAIRVQPYSWDRASPRSPEAYMVHSIAFEMFTPTVPPARGETR